MDKENCYIVFTEYANGFVLAPYYSKFGQNFALPHPLNRSESNIIQLFDQKPKTSLSILVLKIYQNCALKKKKLQKIPNTILFSNFFLPLRFPFCPARTATLFLLSRLVTYSLSVKLKTARYHKVARGTARLHKVPQGSTRFVLSYRKVGKKKENPQSCTRYRLI